MTLKVKHMIFRQLFDPETSTYTYLLADEKTREAVLIDPVREQYHRDAAILDELELKLKYTIETHVHADHVTAGGLFRRDRGSESMISVCAGTTCANHLIEDGQKISFGELELEARTTPGHTDGDMSLVSHEGRMAFTGDALLIRGCGRTDFQQGDAGKLYESVHGKVFSLPDDYKLYPGHDYKGRTVTTVGEEKAHNPRLTKDKASFVELMANLNLQRPKKIDEAVPANLECGLPMEPPPKKQAGAEDGWAPITRGPSGVPEVSTAWAAECPKNVKVLDVREPHEFNDELGHIAGAVLAPLATVEAHVKSWDKTEPVLVVCRSGGRSGKGARILENLGFEKVASMAGGMRAWNAENRPTE